MLQNNEPTYRSHQWLWMPSNQEDCACDECWDLYWREKAADLKDLWPFPAPFQVKTPKADSRIKCNRAGQIGCTTWIEVGERYGEVETFEMVKTLGTMGRLKHNLHLERECVEGFIATKPKEIGEGLRIRMEGLIKKE